MFVVIFIVHHKSRSWQSAAGFLEGRGLISYGDWTLELVQSQDCLQQEDPISLLKAA